MTVAELVSKFFAWCERHLAEATAKKYQCVLSSFVDNFGDREFAGLMPLDVDEWLSEANKRRRDGKEKSRNTQAANATVFLRLQSWGLENRLIDAKIVQKLPKPKSPPRHTMPSDEELGRLMAVAPVEYLRFIQALDWCGARPGELATATVADYDRDEGLIVLKEHKTDRTGKDRTLYVSAECAKLIDQSLVGRDVAPETRLFVKPDGEPWTTQTASGTWARLRKKAGIRKVVRQYDLRHRFCTYVAQNHSVSAAQELAGHSNIQTTMLYIHEERDRLKKIINERSKPKPPQNPTDTH
jgi:integrase